MFRTHNASNHIAWSIRTHHSEVKYSRRVRCLHKLRASNPKSLKSSSNIRWNVRKIRFVQLCYDRWLSGVNVRLASGSTIICLMVACCGVPWRGGVIGLAFARYASSGAYTHICSFGSVCNNVAYNCARTGFDWCDCATLFQQTITNYIWVNFYSPVEILAITDETGTDSNIVHVMYVGTHVACLFIFNHLFKWYLL